MVFMRPLLLLLCGAVAASAATVRLKDRASVTGKILAEKPDQIVIDIGYTVLVIPRAEIVELLHDGAPGAASLTDAPPALAAAEPARAADGDGFYATASSPLREREVRELEREYDSAVVQVRTPEGLGSGFFINDEGFLISNFHVIEGETQISVVVFQRNGDQIEENVYKQVRIVALNKFLDLCLLHIEDKSAPAKFPHVILGDSDKLAVGEGVFAIGSPMGLERTLTQGIISAKTREFEGQLYLQTTAQINPGKSGGPLFNMRGEVVGVTNMKITFGEGLGFAIPIEFVKYFLNHRESFAYDNDNPSNPYRYLQPPSRQSQRKPADAPAP